MITQSILVYDLNADTHFSLTVARYNYLSKDNHVERRIEQSDHYLCNLFFYQSSN